MKNLKVLLVVLALMGASSAFAKATPTSDKIAIETNTTVRRAATKTVVFKGRTYHFRNGKWYITRGRRLVVVRPPVGLAVRSLPRGNKVVVVKGRKFYKFNGVHYQKRGGTYVVVRL
ncbi:DUF6515 family protein [Pseudozobellia thermophila]|uniref:Uncharacterized protein n=1 Tax=Pseudozobellia thermophila TaxID=192903 RepID=A0A1M6FJ63_9FLAO|nr:DUF6515 family protein [Pseudozobellia thermophila]SHI97669.1 hypothetical protein SAMN04488513_102449 [Pseudozobellia thermophila]